MMMIGENNQVTRPNEGGGSMNHDGGDGGAKLKKGPWTVAEDSILAEYVRTHGEGNWNAVQKNTGLARCGKSCRLRWANHLRPNLKKGAFSPDEERIIIELHAKLGNKWARMAAQLPGRTDNEIKNYWNTRVKRKLRQGLSLYPPNIQPVYSQQQYHSQPTTTIASSAPPLKPIASSSSFQSLSSASLTPPSSTSLPLHRSASSPLLYNHQLASSGAPPPQPQPAPCLYSPGPASTPPPPPLPSPSPSTPPHASPLPYPHKPAFQTLPLFDSSTSNTTSTSITSTSDFLFPRHFSFLQTPLGYKRLRPEGDSELTCSNNHNRAVDGSSYNNTSSFMFPVSPLLRSTIFNPHATAAATSSLSPINYTSSSVDPMALDPASSTKILGSPHFDPQFVSTPGYVYPWKTELPSNQFWSHYVQSEVSLHGKGNNNGSSNNDHNENHNNLSMPINGSGLLEDMLQEAQVLAGSNDILRMGFDSSSDQGFASVLKGREAAAEEMNTTTQEDYTKYLNVISSSMPISEWYGDSGEGSNGQSSVITDDNNLGVDIHDLANSILPVDITAAEPGRTSSSCRSWDNLRGFC